MEMPTSTPSQIGARERWITTALLGLGLITFAIDASNTQLILPQVMTRCPFHKYTASSCGLASFPRKRESRRQAPWGLDARLRGHDVLLAPDLRNRHLGRPQCHDALQAVLRRDCGSDAMPEPGGTACTAQHRSR